VHIEYESNLERQWLTLLDFDTSIDKVAAQPLRFNGPVGDGCLDHIPDYFARLASGGGCVVDVKHPHFVDNDNVREQRELTATVCAELGFEYRYLTAIDKQRWANVSWLAGYRRTPLTGSEHVERLLHIASTPTRLDVLCSFGDHPSIVRPIVFHLCWKQQLIFDLGRPLRDDTLISRGNQ
jgi:hypothetical protein